MSLRVVAALASVLVGCSSTVVQMHIASGAAPLCSSSRDLGRVAVVPEAAWRVDQKDVPERLAMATRALDRAFSTAECGDKLEVRPFAPWSQALEQDRLDSLAAAGVDTAVFVRVEELGPTLAVTFSVPFLWVGTSEAQLRLRAIHIPTGRVLLDAGVKRCRGGPFQLRPASWAESELEASLTDLLFPQAGSRAPGP